LQGESGGRKGSGPDLVELLRYWKHQLKKDRSSMVKKIDEILKRNIVTSFSLLE
jgi:hypothetical protein